MKQMIKKDIAYTKYGRCANDRTEESHWTREGYPPCKTLDVIQI